MSEYHTPVLLDESVSALITSNKGIYLDATFGGGGHSREILKRLDKNARLIAFDQDLDAFKNNIDDKRFSLIHSNFRFIENFLNYEMYKDGRKNALDIKANGILADLGVSSHQFDTAQRGFSFRYDAKLDMRMNQAEGISAEDIINDYDEENLKNIFKLYGEIDKAHKLAFLIVKERERKRITTTGDLNNTLKPLLPKLMEHKYLAKVYQALRIEVNQEMKVLERFLEATVRSLDIGGRLVIITYHSLEDRMVKNFIKSGNIRGEIEKDFYGNNLSPFKIINKKAITASENELQDNTRSRSAKLRIAEKIKET